MMSATYSQTVNRNNNSRWKNYVNLRFAVSCYLLHITEYITHTYVHIVVHKIRYTPPHAEFKGFSWIISPGTIFASCSGFRTSASCRRHLHGSYLSTTCSHQKQGNGLRI